MASLAQSPQASPSRHEIWQRWMLFWYGIFYGSLIIATGLTISLDSLSWQRVLLVLALTVLLGAWYAVCIVIPPSYWRSHVSFTLLYLSAGWLLWFVLTNLSPTYLFVLSGLYPQNFILLFSPWGIIGGFLLLFLSIWSQVAEWGGWSEGTFYTLGTGLGGMFLALFIDALVRQSRQRAGLIEELKSTRQDLARAERQAGSMQERQRLAREIHDTFTQGFTSILLQIEASEATQGEQQRTLEQIQRIARENLKEARRLLWALQPEVFEQTNLPEVLTSLAQNWSEESGVRVNTILSGPACPLRPEIEVTLLRAAQEALANIRKHAGASLVTMTLTYLDDVVLLDIQDDGQGFEVEQRLALLCGQSGGFGLKALRSRVEQSEGTLTIESGPGEGTTLAIALPALRNDSPVEVGIN